MHCIKLVARGILAFIVLSSLLTSLLLYYVGSVPRKSWDNNAKLTKCEITGYNIIQEECAFTCDCGELCYQTAQQYICRQSCATCF